MRKWSRELLTNVAKKIEYRDYADAHGSVSLECWDRVLNFVNQCESVGVATICENNVD